MWAARLLLFQPAASGTLSELSAEYEHCPYIITGVASRKKHSGEWRHGKSSGF